MQIGWDRTFGSFAKIKGDHTTGRAWWKLKQQGQKGRPEGDRWWLEGDFAVAASGGNLGTGNRLCACVCVCVLAHPYRGKTFEIYVRSRREPFFCCCCCCCSLLASADRSEPRLRECVGFLCCVVFVAPSSLFVSQSLAERVGSRDFLCATLKQQKRKDQRETHVRREKDLRLCPTIHLCACGSIAGLLHSGKMSRMSKVVE